LTSVAAKAEYAQSKGERGVRAEETMADDSRGLRLQIMLTGDELSALDDWRFNRRMPSRAAAVRELLKRGLSAEGFDLAGQGAKSTDYGVIAASSKPNGGDEA
jgi:hypothetical protein